MKKVKSVEEANYSGKKLKKAALYAGLALVITLTGCGINKNVSDKPKEEPTNESYNQIQEEDWCEPIIEVRYVAPEGYTIGYDENGKVIAYREIEEYAELVVKIDENGDKYVEAPEGYSLKSTENGMVAVKKTKEYAEVETVEVLTAPEGYVLIGDKCYKLQDTEEQTKGR